MSKFCYNCGKKLEDDAIFCNNCGTKITDDDVPSDEKAAPVQLLEEKRTEEFSNQQINAFFPNYKGEKAFAGIDGLFATVLQVRGRSNRLGFLKKVLLLTLLNVMLAFLEDFMFEDHSKVHLLLFVLIYSTFYLMPAFLEARLFAMRLNDINLPGRNISLIIVTNTTLLMTCFFADKYTSYSLAENIFGTLDNFVSYYTVLSVISLILLLVMLFTPGTKGENKYGPTPLD